MASSVSCTRRARCPLIAGGKYEIVRALGEGGMGAVYQARQVAMNRMVAIKLIRTDMGRRADAVSRFLHEMKITAQIEHPNTIRLYDFGDDDGQLYLTMELVAGETLTPTGSSRSRPRCPTSTTCSDCAGRKPASHELKTVLHTVSNHRSPRETLGCTE
jgi:serine/threonine protein kinase